MHTVAAAGAFQEEDPPPLETFMVTYGSPPVEDDDVDGW